MNMYVISENKIRVLHFFYSTDKMQYLIAKEHTILAFCIIMHKKIGIVASSSIINKIGPFNDIIFI